jgi:hypothetical protein
VEARLAKMPDFVEERLADRRFRQIETLSLLRSRPSKEGMIAGLRRLLVDTESWRRPEFRQKMRQRDDQMFALLADLSATFSQPQREHLQKKIRRYLADISKLTGS